MKYFYLLFLIFVASTTMAQKTPSDDTIDFKNAFFIAKNIKLIENHYSDSTLKLNETDRYNALQFISALIWYADLQDDENETAHQKLAGKLKNSYEGLLKPYNAVISRLYNLDSLFKQDSGALSTILAKVKNEKFKIQLTEDLKLFTEALDEKLKITQEVADVENTNNDLIFKYDAVINGLVAERKSNPLDSAVSSLKQDSIDLQKKVFKGKENLDKKKTLLEAADKNLVFAKKTTIEKLLSPSLDVNSKGALNSLFVKPGGMDWNKYVTEQNNEIIKSQNVYAMARSAEIDEPSVKLSSLKLPTEAEMIDAVAIYLVKRVKQESVMWFFETIQKNATQYELIKTFFPNTITLLQGNEVYEIPNLGTQWRYALSKDFIKMPKSVFNSPWLETLFKKSGSGSNNQSLLYIRTAYNACDLLAQNYSFDELIKYMYLTEKPIDSNRITPAHIFSVLYAFRQECFVPSTDSTKARLLRYEDFRNLSKGQLEAMISLMDMKYGAPFTPIWKKTKAGAFLDSPEKAEQFRRWAGKIEAGIAQFNELRNNLSKTTTDRDGKKEDVVYSVFNIWENINGLINIVMPDEDINNSFDYKTVKMHTQKAFEIYNQLSVKNYAGAVNTIISLVEDLVYTDSFKKPNVEKYLQNGGALKSATTKEKKTAKEGWDNLVKKYLDSSETSLVFRQNHLLSAVLFEKDRAAINLIRKLAGFLNDVMLTTDPKQLSRVVESYALPPGSYKRKRNSWYSLDLNAYVGGYYGIERVESKNKWSGVYGITAPIGLSFSKTFGAKLCKKDSLSEDMIRNPDKVKVGHKHIWKRSGHTFSMIVTIVDLGAVVSYRLDSTDASKGLPKDAKWSQLLSPGLRLAYGIKNTPLVFNIGYQYTPELRILNIGFNNTTFAGAHRLSLGLAFDLPLINLWQKSYISSKLKLE